MQRYSRESKATQFFFFFCSSVYIRIPACIIPKVITSHDLVQCVLLTLVCMETAVPQFVMYVAYMLCDVCVPASYSPTVLPLKAIITPSPLWKIAAVVFKLCLITSNTPGTKSRGHP